MKRILRYLCVSAVGLSLLSSCSTDEMEPSSGTSELWKGELSDAPYEKDAVCLNFSDAEVQGLNIKSIELTGSGLYFINYDNETDSDLAEPGYRSGFRKSRNITKLSANDIPDIQTGNFTPLGANKFRLNQWGDITINSDGTVSVELLEGSSYIWNATKSDKIEPTALNSRLCRTWDIVGAHIDCLDEDLNVIYSFNLSQKEVEREYVEAICFTSAGRFYQKDGSWDGGTWNWSNPALQLLITAISDSESSDDAMFQVLFDQNYMEVMMPIPFIDGEEAQWEYSHLTGSSGIPDNTRYTREYFNLKAMN